MSTVVIRVDAGGVIGTGHVMRMIALAQGISRNGAKPIILTAECPDKLVERIAKEKITHIQLADTLLGSDIDAEKTIHVLQEYDAEWLVTDGYHFDFAYQQWIVTTGKKLLCLDDHGYSKNWACDAVLNQNLDAENWAKYNQGDSKKSLQLLLGLKYGLLREEFCGGRGKLPVSKKAPIKKLLITLGGSDPNNITGEILECIGKIDFLNSIEIRVLLGADNQNVKSLKERYSSNAIELLQNVHDMPAQFEWADGVISAGGSTCWEILRFNLPLLAVVIADNQKPVVESLVKCNLAESLGNFPSKDKTGSEKIVHDWLINPFQKIDSEKLASTVDSLGADRVAAYLTSKISIRSANPSDSSLYFEWVNDSMVRAMALNKKPIIWDEHEKWFKRMLASNDNVLFVGEVKEALPVGQVRFDRVNDSLWTISISIGKAHRGSRLSSVFLKKSLEEMHRRYPTFSAQAFIRMENESSQRLFKSLGFVKTMEFEGILTFQMRLD